MYAKYSIYTYINVERLKAHAQNIFIALKIQWKYYFQSVEKLPNKIPLSTLIFGNCCHGMNNVVKMFNAHDKTKETKSFCVILICFMSRLDWNDENSQWKTLSALPHFKFHRLFFMYFASWIRYYFLNEKAILLQHHFSSQTAAISIYFFIVSSSCKNPKIGCSRARREKS